MPTVYLTEQGTTLQKESETVLVTWDEKPLLRVPIARVERVMVLGNVQLTTQVIGLLLDHGVDVSF
ncbi:MAG: CRISPR-associated endonuclease Cas1, partial [Candidatus Latescibacteria bacterium]|nr:CRISPR-associated endonuclease Cas1 [Candidatus Latescibacterota bacterium]